MKISNIFSAIKSKSFRTIAGVLVLVVVGSYSFLANPKHAMAIVCPTTFTWTGLGGDNFWNDAANWDAAPCIPATGDDLIFPPGAAQPSNLNNLGAMSFNSITFNGNGYTIISVPGPVMPVIAGITDNASGGTNTNTISMPVLVGAAESFTVTDLLEHLVIDATMSVDLNGNALTFDGAGTITVQGIIYDVPGTGSVIKNGTGRTYLAGVNTYSGQTNINAGELGIENNDALGTADGTDATGTTVADGATLSIATDGLVIGNELLTLNGTGTGVANGALANVDHGTWNGNIVLASDSTIMDVVNLTLNGVISGAFNLTKGGGGTTSLGNVNTYTGNTDIAAGTLQLFIANAIPATSDVTVEGGATLDMDGYVDTIGSLAGAGNVTMTGNLTTGGSNLDTVFSGQLSAGVGLLTKNGTGKMTLSGDNSAWSGGIFMNDGIILLNNSNAAGSSPISVEATSTLQLGDVITINNPITLNSTAVPALENVTGNNIIAGVLTLRSNSTMKVDNVADTLNLSNIVDEFGGSFGITKTGPGVLDLSGANTFSGDLAVDGGSVDLKNSAAAGTGFITVITPGSLQLEGGITTTNSILLDTTAPAAIENIGGDNTISTVGGHNLTLNQNEVFSVDGASHLTVSTVILDDGGSRDLTKTGTGTLILSADNTYGGATNINAGTLQLGAAGVIPDGSNVNVLGAATFDLNGHDEAIGSLAGGGFVTIGGQGLTTGGNNNDTTFSGSITGTIDGQLIKNGTGKMILSGTNDGYLGGLLISNGSVDLTDSSAAGTGDISVNGSGSLQLEGDITIMNGIQLITDAPVAIENISGNNTLSTVPGGRLLLNQNEVFGVADATQLTVSTPINDIGGHRDLTKTGDGTLILSADNTYSGATNINAGTLQLGVSNALPATNTMTVEDGATFDKVNYDQTLAAINGTSAGHVSLGDSGVLTISNNADETLGVLMSGMGSLVKSGTAKLTLTANNTYTGSTTVHTGTLFVNGSQPGSAIVLQSGTTLGGSGTTGSVTSTGGTIAPGSSPGQINTGDVTLDGSSNYNEEINGTSPGTQYDVLNSSGSVHLGDAHLNVSLGGFTPTIGTAFNIIQSTGGISGVFHGLPEGSLVLVGSHYFVISYLSNKVMLTSSDLHGNTSPGAPGGGGGGGGGSVLITALGGGGGGTPGTGGATTGNTGNSTNNPPTSNTGVHGAAPQTGTSSTYLVNFFTDTENHWAKNQIDDILYTCKVAGYQQPQGNILRLFKPDQQITRAELFTMIMRCKVGPLQAVGTAPFTDVPADHWAAPYIAKGLELGLIKGYPDGTFKPNQPISRAEALKAVLLTWYTLGDITSASQNNQCSDVNKTAWYAQYFSFAINNNILIGPPSGSSSLCKPEDNTTRAESAVVIIKVKRTAESSVSLNQNLAQNHNVASGGTPRTFVPVKVKRLDVPRLHGVRRVL